MRMPKIVLVIAALAAASAPAAADEWKNSVALYGWGTSVEMDTVVRGQEVDSESQDFSDIFDNIEMGALMRYEGRNENWGVLADVIYLGLGFPSANTAAELDADTTVIELAGSWHANEHLEVLFGARYMDLGIDVDFAAIPDIEQSKSWIDGIAGLRVSAPLGESWRWVGRVDIGTGGSDFALNTETFFLWDATDHFSLAAGWRYMTVDYDEGSGNQRFALDAALNGPELGFVLRF